MKLYAFALVLCVGLAVGAEVDSVPEVPSDLQQQLDELQLADKPEAPLDDAEQPLPPSGDELPEDAPEPVPEDGSPDEEHPEEEQEEEADESESEESEESDELEEARLVAEELEERQQELDYLKRYLVGRLQAVAILDRRVRPAVLRRPWIRRPWIRRPGVLPRLPVL